MHNFLKQLIGRLKATVKYIIVAFIFSIIILSATYILFSKTINDITSTIDLISIKTNKKILKDVKIDKKPNTLITYPSYGANYATLKIASIGVELPIYYGDDLDILKYGVGHTAGTYFPGEGGSIVYMAHNTANMLRRLPEIKNGDEIEVKTTYDTYYYTVYNGKVIEETDFDSVPVNREKEVLMIYTCYPTTAITHTPYRYIVYASRKGE